MVDHSTAAAEQAAGQARVDDRKVLNGIYWRLRTGAPWADIPKRYGLPTTCYNRFVRWQKLGVWDRIFEAVTAGYEGDLQMIDSSSIRVHQHGAHAKKGGPQAAPGDEPDPRCMGRSRGELITKIHALVDARGRPIVLKLTPGQAHDGTSATATLNGVGEGQILLADRAYDSNALCQALENRGAWACIKAMPSRLSPPAFSAFPYRDRNLVERFFNKLKHFRAVATRSEKHPDNYLVLVKLAAIKILLRPYESVS